MEHLSSGGMFLKEELKTPDYKANSAAKSMIEIMDLIKSLPETTPERVEAVERLLSVRQTLVENIDAVEDDNKKIEYHKLIVDSDEFLPGDQKSQEL